MPSHLIVSADDLPHTQGLSVRACPLQQLIAAGRSWRQECKIRRVGRLTPGMKIYKTEMRERSPTRYRWGIFGAVVAEREPTHSRTEAHALRSTVSADIGRNGRPASSTSPRCSSGSMRPRRAMRSEIDETFMALLTERLMAATSYGFVKGKVDPDDPSVTCPATG
jgi:hypothetical protein